MTSCCPPPRMRWSGATGAIARCKRVSTGCGRKSRSVRAWRWICGVKPKPKAGNTPVQHFIVHGLDKPGSSATVSEIMSLTGWIVFGLISALWFCYLSAYSNGVRVKQLEKALRHRFVGHDRNGKCCQCRLPSYDIIHHLHLDWFLSFCTEY